MSDQAGAASPSALTAEERNALQALRSAPGWFDRSARVLGLAGFFGLWQLISTVVLPRLDANLVTLMPPPTAVLAAAWELILSGDLFKHFWASLKREVVAFAYASVAIPIGILMGWSKTAQSLLEPVFEMLRPIPPIAWIPLAILWFGIGDPAKPVHHLSGHLLSPAHQHHHRGEERGAQRRARCTLPGRFGDGGADQGGLSRRDAADHHRHPGWVWAWAGWHWSPLNWWAPRRAWAG